MTNTLTLTQNVFVKTYNLIQDFISKVSERNAKVQMVRKTIKELNTLTDRDLQDIGLSRYDIEMIAREHAESLEIK